MLSDLRRPGKVRSVEPSRIAPLPRLIAALVVMVSALAVWTLFYPGILSEDSLEQYRQALTGDYSNWHPPFMSATLALLLQAGGNLGMLMLFSAWPVVLAYARWPM